MKKVRVQTNALSFRRRIGVLFALTFALALLISCNTDGVSFLGSSLLIYQSTSTKTVVDFDQSEDADGYVKWAQTQSLALFYNEELDAISIRNEDNGFVWSSRVDMSNYGLEEPVPLERARTSSMISLVYTDANANEGKLNYAYTVIEKSKRIISRIDNGFSLRYDFTMLKISVVLEFSLNDNGLSVRIPSGKIEEGTRYLLMGIELMPALGATNHQDSGYYFYPDGSGALMHFDDYTRRAGNPTKLTLGVYGLYNPENISDYYSTLGASDTISPPLKYEAALPIYGVKKGGNAMLAYITEGAAQSKINIMPEGYVVDFNRIGFEFQYRETFDIYLSSIAAGNESDLKSGTKVDNERMDQTYEATFTLLNGDDSTYSSMAQIYRSYLQEVGLLKNTAQATVPLVIDIFCGATEDRMLVDKFIAATTFSQAKEILAELYQQGVDRIEVTLKGWTKDGYGHYVNLWPAARQLGGKNGMKMLLNYCVSQNVSLYAMVSPLLATNNDGGFNIRQDVIYTGNILPYTDFDRKLYMLNGKSVAQRLQSLSGNLNKLGTMGLSLDGLGKIVYSNYNNTSFAMRSRNAEEWELIMSGLSKRGHLLALDYGNQYTLAYADRLYQVPNISSQTALADESVPFFQMIVHGSIPYTTNAGNLFYDAALQKLNWVEYGCMPYYEFTYQRATVLKHTDYNRLYTSYYKDWMQIAADMYKEMNDRLAGTWDSMITEHIRLTEMLVRVRYESGKTVYVNYDDEPAKADGHIVPALDYLVVSA